MNKQLPKDNCTFIVTIDVEADNVWKDPANLTIENLGIISEFQRLCNTFNIVPTYLLSYETLSDVKFVAFLKDVVAQNKCEVGMHPHVWTIPPFIKEKDGIDVAVIRHYQGMLNEDILIKKLDTLYKRIQDRIGINPTSHRAGRWGLCLRTIKWLENKGFIADSSVVPLKSFATSALDPKVYPDYYNAFLYPYRMSRDAILKKGSLNLVEVPTTNINSYNLPLIIKFADLMKDKRGGTRLRKLLDKLSMYPLELRPFPEYSPGTLPEIAGIALKKNLPIVNLMFHSSELMVGGSPYSANEYMTESIWAHLMQIFSFANENDLSAVGISKAIKLLQHENYF